MAMSKIVTSKGFVMYATFGPFPYKTAECESLMGWLNDIGVQRTPKSATKKSPINGSREGYFVFTPYKVFPKAL